MRPPRTFIIVLFVCLTAACGGHSTVNTPPGAGCDENYDPCVPIASDVDCAGGPGNGPEYVQGPVKVVGKDIYELDRDKNGIGCEKRN